jgi:F-type H+-transporting ATPase subunit alpha
LSRGQLLTEILKQPQYSPLSVWQQVASILAATSGAFDNIEIEKAKAAQDALLTDLEQHHKKMVAEIDKGTPPTTADSEIILRTARKAAEGYKIVEAEKAKAVA